MNMSGNEGRQSGWVRDFAEKLQARSGLTVRLWDERLTTKEAERVLRASGISRVKRGLAVDRLSAVILLASYLEALPSGGRRRGPARMKLRRVVLVLLRWRRSWRPRCLCERPTGGLSRTRSSIFPVGTRSARVAGMLADAGVLRSRWEFMAVRALRPKAKLHAGEYRLPGDRQSLGRFRAPGEGRRVLLRTHRARGEQPVRHRGRGREFGNHTAGGFSRGAPRHFPDSGFGAGRRYARRLPVSGHLPHHPAHHSRPVVQPDDGQVPGGLGAARRAAVRASRRDAGFARREGDGAGRGAAGDRLRVPEPPRTGHASGLRSDRDLRRAAGAAAITGELSRSDLDSKNRYNTYQYAGLPPGPIANPGLAALNAALHPADTHYLYFVAQAGWLGDPRILGESRCAQRRRREISSCEPQSETKRARLSQYLAASRPARITETELRELRERLAPISGAYLQQLVRASGSLWTPLWRVFVKTPSRIGADAAAIGEEYAKALESGDTDAPPLPAGRDHRQGTCAAGGAPARRSPGNPGLKQEMAAWMLLWLENPAIFPTWLGLRKKAGITQT